ncbi:hypothetical protein DFJ68_3533 [Terracoccus luteus]|uniref:YdbS-like PH domain-containing protein n=1 Tax=Terracoccus luteus TaxID=53356 RepID=A0A495Y3G8_9MICO|nr:hypothetical protein DFJ68_3533 [Terracoccus luteus]
MPSNWPFDGVGRGVWQVGGVDDLDETPPTAVLRDPAHRVSPRARRMWALEAVLGELVVLAGQVVWWFLDDGGRTTHWVVFAVWLVVAVAYTAVMPVWRYRVHRWESTEHAIYTQSGWLTQERRIAPLSRVQTVDLQRGPLERLFRLATVTVTTASAAGPLEISGLDLPVAQRLVEGLTAAAVLDEGDAT